MAKQDKQKRTKKNPRKYRTEEQKVKDRADIAKLYLRGWFQASIAEHLNQRPDNPPGYSIKQQTVSVEIRSIRKTWETSALIDFNERISIEVAKWDNLEMMYHKAYINSLKPIEEDTEGIPKEKDSKKETECVDGEVYFDDELPEDAPKDLILLWRKKKKRPEGNLQALAGVERCLIGRQKLLGLLTNKVDLTSKGDKIQGNVVVLPDNNIMTQDDFDEDKMNEYLKTLQAEGKSDQ